jgi:hypothetical protein
VHWVEPGMLQVQKYPSLRDPPQKNNETIVTFVLLLVFDGFSKDSIKRNQSINE